MTIPLPSIARVALPALVVLFAACDASPEASPFSFAAADPAAAPPSTADDVPDDDDPDAPGDGDPAAVEPDGDAAGLRVFLTTLAYTADLGGIVGADEICQFEAEGAQLSGRWRAWISDSSIDAIDRITGDGPWVDTGGTLLFNNHAHLRTAPLSPIVLDPYGQDTAFHDSVWTGTGTGGRRVWPDTCGDWTTEDWTRDAGSGITAVGGQWTDSGPLPCEWEARLYCFEVAID